MNDEFGCSVCLPGAERYTTFRYRDRRLAKKFGTMVQYDYRTTDGRLFSCVAKTLEACRAKRDAWLQSL